jgi:hypothetical protein
MQCIAAGKGCKLFFVADSRHGQPSIPGGRCRVEGLGTFEDKEIGVSRSRKRITADSPEGLTLDDPIPDPDLDAPIPSIYVDETRGGLDEYDRAETPIGSRGYDKAVGHGMDCRSLRTPDGDSEDLAVEIADGA